MKTYIYYILVCLLACMMLSSCKKGAITPVCQYFPMNVNNEWVYAINGVYHGLDTLRVKVIAKAVLSNNQPCWQMTYEDLYVFYKDTIYRYISNNKDTVLTYVNQNDSSLSEKWILANIKNNTWTGVDTSDNYYFQLPFDSMSGFGITYYNMHSPCKS